MPTTLESPPIKPPTPSREVLHRNVVDRLDDLSDQELAALHDALLRSMKQRLWDDISAEAGADHRAGLMDDLPGLLREVRSSARW